MGHLHGCPQYGQSVTYVPGLYHQPNGAQFWGGHFLQTITPTTAGKKEIKIEVLKKEPVPVASYAANGFGLYDMAGNEYEWSADAYDKSFYKRSPGTDPRNDAGKERVTRGGSYVNIAGDIVVSRRWGVAPNRGAGFRCVRDAAP
jgi:formylglycine-generating enzyme required for sulfatase activity